MRAVGRRDDEDAAPRVDAVEQREQLRDGERLLLRRAVAVALRAERVHLIENCLLYTSPSPRDS